MKKEDILLRSREENKKGDEFVKIKKETALHNSYLFTTTCLYLLAISCYLGIISGTVVINGMKFNLQDILWAIAFSTSLIEYGSMYAYFKQKKFLVYTIFFFVTLIGCIISIIR